MKRMYGMTISKGSGKEEVQAEGHSWKKDFAEREDSTTHVLTASASTSPAQPIVSTSSGAAQLPCHTAGPGAV